MIKSSRIYQREGAFVYKLMQSTRTPEGYENEFCFRVTCSNLGLGYIEREKAEEELAQKIIDLLNENCAK